MKEFYMVFTKKFEGKVFTREAYKEYTSRLTFEDFMSLESKTINLDQAFSLIGGELKNIVTVEDLENL